MPLARATIEILDADAVDESRGLPRVIEVQFNPGEYTLQKGAQIAEIAIPGIDAPLHQFVRGQTEKLSLELFFDSTEQGMGDSAADVRERTRSIYQLVKIQPRTHAPPRIRFTWGQGLSFKAVVESVQQKFTLFSPAGVPLRATVTVSFREYRTLEEQLAELNLQSADHTRTRTLRRGDTLDLLAAQEYGDPRLWRVLADANRITNPRRLVPGREIELPARRGPS
jgi:hypothetical protein